MSLKQKLSGLFRNLFMRAGKDRDVDEELESYVGLLAEEKIQAGFDPRTAAREARVELGGKESVKEKIRQYRLGHSIDTMVQDIRFGLRMLRKNPGFTLVAVLTLALGIGANTAIFSFVYGILIHPLPYQDPDRLVRISEILERDGERVRLGLSGVAFFDLLEGSETLDLLGIYTTSKRNLGTGEATERVQVALVTSSMLHTLGVAPVAGRLFLPEEVQRGNRLVAILSYSLWQSRYGGQPLLDTLDVNINGSPHRVVGVMPPDFEFPNSKVVIWLPLTVPPGSVQGRYSRHYPNVARLAPSVTLEHAQEEIKRFTASRDVEVFFLYEELVGGVRPTLLILFAGVGVLLLISYVNVASLLLARSAAREKELALRAALGAGRRRLVQQMLTESLLVALLGGLGGFLILFWCLDLILSVVPTDIPRLGEVAVNFPTLFFTLVCSVAASVLLGILPVLYTFRVDVTPVLNGVRHGSQVAFLRQGVRKLFVVSEVALVFVLLIGGGLLLNSFVQLVSVDPGYDPDNVLSMQVLLPRSKYRQFDLQKSFYDDFLPQLEDIPEVIHVGISSGLPMAGKGEITLYAEGLDFSSDNVPVVNKLEVNEGYFDALRLRILDGRSITEEDTREGIRVAVVNQTLARRFFGNDNPIGRLVRNDPSSEPYRISGVVSDVKQFGLDTEARPEIYFSYLQSPNAGTFLHSMRREYVVLRTVGDPLAVLPAVRTKLRTLEPEAVTENVQSMRQRLSVSVAGPRFWAFMMSSLSLLGLLLATVGIFGLVSYSVTERTSEMGVRIALGARPGDLLRLILQETLALVVGGLGIGSVAGLVRTQYLSSQLFAVSAMDPLTFLSVALLLLGVTALACYIPARRATKVDPMVALRYE